MTTKLQELIERPGGVIARDYNDAKFFETEDYTVIGRAVLVRDVSKGTDESYKDEVRAVQLSVQTNSGEFGAQDQRWEFTEEEAKGILAGVSVLCDRTIRVVARQQEAV